MVVPIDRIPGMPTRVRRALEGIGSEFVPYTGAIKDTDLGAFDLTAAEITATTYASAYSIATFVVLHAGGGVGNTCVGIEAGNALTSGTWNTLVGNSAGEVITAGHRNTLIGAEAGLALTTGVDNVFCGYQSGIIATDAEKNVCIGATSGLALTSGIGNILIGDQAGEAVTDGDYNILIGGQTGEVITTASNNTFIGRQAGAATTTGADNVFFGYRAGYTNITGSWDVCIGYEAGATFTAAHRSVMIGYRAGYVATGTENTLIGFEAGRYLTSPNFNTFIGKHAGFDITTGGNNVFVGKDAGDNFISAANCTALGYSTVTTLDSVSSSIALGAYAELTASNQFVVGDVDAPITDVYIGEGVTSASPQDVTLNATGGSGTDTEAKDLILAGGKSTGDAVPGDILFKTATAGASGTTLQSLTTRLSITGVTADFSGLNLTTTGTVTTGTLTIADGSITDSDGTISINGDGGADVLNLTTNLVNITRGDLILQAVSAGITADFIYGNIAVTTPELTVEPNSNLLIENPTSNYDIIFTFNDGGATKSFTIDASANTLNLDTGNITTTGVGTFANIDLIRTAADEAVDFYDGAVRKGYLIYRGSLGASAFFGFQNFSAAGGLRFYNDTSFFSLYQRGPNTTDTFRIFTENAAGTSVVRFVLGNKTDAVNLELTSTSLVFKNTTAGLLFAEVYAHLAADAITSVAQNDWDQITAFDTDGENNGATPDHTNDHITILTAGKYSASFHWCGHGPAAAHDWDFHLAKNNNFAQFNNLTAHLTSPTTQKDTSVSCMGIIDLAVDDTIELWVKRTSAGNNIVLTTDTCGITLTQIGGT